MFFKETLTDCLILFICRTECVSPIAAILAALNSACNKGGQRLNTCVTKCLASLAQVNHLNLWWFHYSQDVPALHLDNCSEDGEKCVAYSTKDALYEQCLERHSYPNASTHDLKEQATDHAQLLH